MAEVCLTFRICWPWWKAAFVAGCIVVARCGLAIDAEKAARFLADHTKFELA